MTTRKTVLFDCRDTYQGTIQRMAHQLGRGFEALGWKFGTYSFTSLAEAAPLADAINTGTLGLVVSMSTYSSGSYEQFGPFLTRDTIPFFLFGFDHPAYAYGEMSEMLIHLRPLFFSFTVPDFINTAQTLWPDRANYRMLTQAVEIMPVVPLADRTGPGLMAGNRPSYGPMQPVWPDDLPPEATPFGPLRDQLIAHFKANPSAPLFQTIWEVFPGLTELDKRRLAIVLDLANRIRVRTEAIQTLADYDVELCGTGWEHLGKPGSKLIQLGSVHNDQVLEKIGRAKFLINAVPEYYSCSERILEAAMTGCPVITTWTEYLQEEFGDCLWYYRTPDDLRGAIDAVQSGQGVAEKVARAREIVVDRHTWTHRAESILKMTFLA